MGVDELWAGPELFVLSLAGESLCRKQCFLFPIGSRGWGAQFLGGLTPQRALPTCLSPTPTTCLELGEVAVREQLCPHFSDDETGIHGFLEDPGQGADPRSAELSGLELDPALRLIHICCAGTVVSS